MREELKDFIHCLVNKKYSVLLNLLDRLKQDLISQIFQAMRIEVSFRGRLEGEGSLYMTT